ncbi:nitroreductase [Allopusillimonas ginsengisoli]|uniref:nitroreductase family protein n=1 Tax=Allopusillimonas ginsengisoli TaxID=453575 RepID=UPI0010C1AAE2|nr:nitroreductase [Allopusillimonas ginsengisoli]
MSVSVSVAPVDSLLSRRSVKLVQAPAPSDDELSLILEAAMRAPDHGRLRPWRFAIIRGDAVGKLADMSISRIKETGGELTSTKEESVRRWLANVPMLIAVACRLDHANTKIPERERMLATGAAVTNMLNAAHMLGYGAFWSTGLGTYVEEVAEDLGFDPLDYIFMGYVSLGTPINPVQPMERPDFHEYVTEWSGV